VSGFFVGHRGHRFASSAPIQSMTDAFVVQHPPRRRRSDLDLIHFRKGQRKDDIAQCYLRDQ